MTVVLRHSEKLELNLVEYEGEITLDELKALAAYGARHPEFLKSDALNLIQPSAHFSMDLHSLDVLFLRYTKLFARLDFQIYRRSAWVCRSPSAIEHMNHWGGGRDLREGMSSTVRIFDHFAEAGDWLLLSGAEIAQLERGDGFDELTRFDLAAAPLSIAR